MEMMVPNRNRNPLLETHLQYQNKDLINVQSSHKPISLHNHDFQFNSDDDSDPEETKNEYCKEELVEDFQELPGDFSNERKGDNQVTNIGKWQILFSL